MIKFNIQMFGGNGSDYSDNSPSGGSGIGNQNWGARYGDLYKPAETLKEALGQKGTPIDTNTALKNVNPNRKDTFNYGEFTENCQRCVVAYEMNRRGYDVEALPTSKNDNMGQMYTIKQGQRMIPFTNGNWNKAFRGARTLAMGAKTAAKAQKNVEKQMQEWGNGSRAIVIIKGHVFNAENRNGKVFYVDAQIGKRYHPQGIFAKTDPREVMLTRTDNLRISERAKELVKKR